MEAANREDLYLIANQNVCKSIGIVTQRFRQIILGRRIGRVAWLWTGSLKVRDLP